MRTVLVVDDDPSLRFLLSRILERAGFQVLAEACDGLEAIRLARSLRPQVVLLDLLMPTMDGWSALPTLRSELPGSHIVALSMLLGSEVGQKAVAHGADAFLDKGLDNDEFVARLQEVLKRPRLAAPPATGG